MAGGTACMLIWLQKCKLLIEVSFFFLKIQLYLMQEKLAFKPGHGGFPHASYEWAGHRQGEALAPKLQDMFQCTDGETKCGVRQHSSPHGDPDGENKN